MNELEKQLHYPFGDALPAPGAAMLVAPGVKWIRMSLPFALNHINLWLLRDELDGVQGWSVVDCCISNDAARAQWEQIFNQELDGLPILRVIVTHMHPDHVGLARRCGPTSALTFQRIGFGAGSGGPGVATVSNLQQPASRQ